MSPTAYVHGYSPREARRLSDQAGTLVDLLHHDTRYPAGSSVLEAGCGTGAQTITLAARSPGASFTSVDIAPASLDAARDRLHRHGITSVTLQQADVHRMPFGEHHFDHVFACFLLEHLPDPGNVLLELRRVLRPGGTITVIEGDHGSAYFHPDSEHARRAIQCLVDLQARAGGNALVGRQLQPLLAASGFRDISVSPRVVYADATRPAMVEGFTLNTFTAMVEGVGEQAIAAGMIDRATWATGIAALRRTAGPGGVFNYTFFKAVAVK